MQGIDLQPSERSLAMTPDQARAEPPGLLALALSFARIGMSSFGGGNAAWIRRELVERRRWLAQDEFLTGYAMCQVMPGATTVNLSIFCGTKLRGVAGALSACAGIVLPPMLIIVLAGLAYFYVGKSPLMQHLLAGVSAAAVGLTLQMGLSSARRSFGGWIEWLLALAVIAMVGWLRWPILDAIASVGPISILLAYHRAGR